MSDPKPEDEVHEPGETPPRPPDGDPSARLAELLAKPFDPFEPATRPDEPHRDVPAWLAAARADAPVKLPPVSFVNPFAPPPNPEPVAVDPPAAPVEPSAPPTDTLDELAAIMAKLGDKSEKASDAAEPSATSDQMADVMARLGDELEKPSAEPHWEDAAPVEPPHLVALADTWSEPPAEPPPPAGRADPLAGLADQGAKPADLLAKTSDSAAAPREASAEPASQEMPAEPPLDPAAARIITKIRRLMLISSLTTVVGVAAIFGVIGYRVFKSGDSPAPVPATPPVPPVVLAPPIAAAPPVPLEATLTLPKDARIIHTEVAENLLVIAVEIGGTIEIRTYDLKTLKPVGRLSFTEVP